jgi:integrase
MELGHSAWSLKLVRSALRKLYGEPSLASDVALPHRRKIDIKRSRFPVAMDKEFSITRNRDLVDFAKAAGLRRHEVQNVMVKDVRQLDGKWFVFVPQGKGGKMRSVPVLESMVDRVKEITQGKEQDSFLFEQIPVRADVHGYRREYAQELYQEKLEDESPNGAKEITSHALGHERLNVLKHYIE